jgi:hypothetical protein
MMDPAANSVIACDKREAFAQGNEATKRSSVPGGMDCFAALAMTVKNFP